jgi:hypothetical protein
VSGRSCEIASRRRRSIDRRKAGTAIHCGIGPDNAQKRIKYGNSRRKATSRTFRSLFRTFEASSNLSEASSDFSKSLQDSTSIFRTFHYILPDSPGHSATSPAQPRRGITGYRAGHGRGEPRLRKSSARRLYHPPITRTVLLEFIFLGPTGPTDEERNFRARSDRYSTVPHPVRSRNLASRPCTVGCKRKPEVSE